MRAVVAVVRVRRGCVHQALDERCDRLAGALHGFLDARGAAITEDEVAMLDRLLDLTDSDLWDLIAGRADPPDDALAPMVRALRAC